MGQIGARHRKWGKLVARGSRVIVAGGIYHVFARGNNKADIFLDSVDRSWYLRLLAATVRDLNVKILSYVLMSNHVHLVVQITTPNLAEVMHSVHSPYAAHVNRRHDHTGHTFSSRYKSKIIIDDRHLLETTRYVHLNPVRAGLVRLPEDYTWSSYGYYRGEGRNQLVDPALVLSILADDPVRGRKAYEKFVGAGIDRLASQTPREPVPGLPSRSAPVT